MRGYDRVILKAFAKINLYLEITGILPEGYHELDSVMQSVDLHDIIIISKEPFPGVRLACSNPGVPAGAGNTAYKAAEAFMAAAGLTGSGTAIYISKNIPMQSGLAGGSADAAAVLVGLNALFDAGVSQDGLCGIGAPIGADVSFCVKGGTMRAQGKGEKLTALNPIEGCRFVIAKPHEGIDTAGAYKKYDEFSGALPRHDITDMLEAVGSGVTRGIGCHMYNVFENVYEIGGLGTTKEEMRRLGAFGSAMTGTGSAVAGIFEKAPDSCGLKYLKKYCAEVFSVNPVPSGTDIIYAE